MATEYEVVTSNQHRMQIICQKCGRVSDIQDKAIARLIKERKYSNFTLQHFSLFIYGAGPDVGIKNLNNKLKF